jgi:threonine synthase
VPTGNFGNVYAGYAAQRMGLPIERFHVGSNRNDILARLFRTGEMSVRPVEPSLSPSMDIQISSNLERLLFDLYDRDGKALAADMASFRKTGTLNLTAARRARLDALFSGFRLDDAGTLAVIADLQKRTGEIVDPHSAIGVAAAREAAKSGAVPVVALATAHPAKFGDAVRQAVGREPALPSRLARVMTETERCKALPNDLAKVEAYIRETLP